MSSALNRKCYMLFELRIKLSTIEPKFLCAATKLCITITYIRSSIINVM